MSAIIQLYRESLLAELFKFQLQTARDWCFNLDWLLRFVSVFQDGGTQYQETKRYLNYATRSLSNAGGPFPVDIQLRKANDWLERAWAETPKRDEINGVELDDKSASNARKLVEEIDMVLGVVNTRTTNAEKMFETESITDKKIAERICMDLRLHFLLSHMSAVLRRALKKDDRDMLKECRELHEKGHNVLAGFSELQSSLTNRIARLNA